MGLAVRDDERLRALLEQMTADEPPAPPWNMETLLGRCRRRQDQRHAWGWGALLLAALLVLLLM